LLEQQVERQFRNLPKNQQGDGYVSKAEQQENTGMSQIQHDWRVKQLERIRSFRSRMPENEKELFSKKSMNKGA
jgi:hypothetical protein